MVPEKRIFDGLTTSGESCIIELSRLSKFSGQPMVSPEWIIVDAATAVEVHVDRALESLVSHSGLATIPAGAAFLARYSDDMSKTWDARYEWLSDGFGIKIKGTKFQQDFQVAVECRNAIVHGSGRLTKRQQNSFSKFVQLRNQLNSVLDVKVHGTEILFSTDSIHNSLRVASAYIHGFDRAVLDVTTLDY